VHYAVLDPVALTLSICYAHAMNNLPHRPKSASEFTYEDGHMHAFPECAHEWPVQVEVPQEAVGSVIKDANGNPLQDGDSIAVIKDLAIKGTSSVVKVGTKVKNIRLIDGHHIDCTIDGTGPIRLKS
jgi:protein PhnA